MLKNKTTLVMRFISLFLFLRLASWLVSHCKAPSGRDDYVQRIKSTAQVDVCGKCSGNLSLQRGSSQEGNQLSQYKFYIAFENSKCPEYVTEKLYKIINSDFLDNPPVPIVMGPDKAWYNQHLPEKSFIHVDDFADPEELGRYLKHLTYHNDKYIEYLNWRKHYKLVCKSPVRCKLCDMLIRSSFNPKKVRVISDFEAFWKRAACKN